MGGAPKEQTTKVEPWDGAKPYLTDVYKQYNDLIAAGAPAQWSGSTVADQSAATKAGQTGTYNYASNAANSNILGQASQTANNIANGSAISQTGNNALQSLLGGVNVGSNPAANTVNGIANGSKNGQAPGSGTINAGMNYSDPSLKNTAGLAGSLTNNYTNPGLAATQNAAGTIASSYTNPGVAATQNAMQGVNANYANPAIQQAANSNNFTNAATGLQTQQANGLASANNPALANLQATASGANIGKNAYLDQSVTNATQKIADQLANVTNPQIMGGAAGAGRLGSNAFASQLNNAQSAAADAMTKTATDMYANQYNTDVSNMLGANSQYGNFYNSDVSNQLNANSALAGTSNSQQSQRLNGTQLYGDLNNTQQGLRNDGSNILLNGAGQLGSQSIAQQGMNNDLTGLRLNAANQLGNQSATQQGLRNDQTSLMLNANGQLSSQALAQNGQRLDAANAANSQYNTDRNYQMAGLGLQNDMYQQGVANQFTNAGLKADAANSLNGNQNAQNNLSLAGAAMAGQNYQNGMLPYQSLLQLGQSQDGRNQDILNNTIQRYEQAQQQPLTNLGNFANLLNGGGYSNTTTPVYSNTGSQIMGGISSALGALALFCDARAKTIIRQVGKLPTTDGATIPMYEFTYKHDPEQTVYVGPVAQEVEEVLPEAVAEVDGVKFVLVTPLMEAI